MTGQQLTAEQTTALREWIEEGALVRGLQHEAMQTERLEALRALATEHGEAKAALEAAAATAAQRTQAAKAAENRADDLRARITRTETKLNDGTGLTSSDLLGLQDEIAGLRGMVDEVELQQMEELEAAEAAQTEAAAAQTRAEDIAGRGRALQQERASEGERIAQDLAAHEATRAGLLERIPAGLHGRLRSQGDYPPAALVTAASCGACGAQLSGSIADAFGNLDAGGLLDCENCGALLLKTA